MTFWTHKDSFGSLVGRDGPSLRIEPLGNLLDLTGAQHSLLYSRPPASLVERRLDELAPTALAGVSRHASTEEALALCDWIALYGGEPGVDSHLLSGGTEAFEAALAVAVDYQRLTGRPTRNRIAGLEYSYHGFSLGAVSAGDHPTLRLRSGRQPWPTVSRADLVSEDTMIARIHQMLATEQIAGLIVEPIGGTTSGGLAMPVDVLREMRRMCMEYDVLFIADEVVCGLGRTGRPFELGPELFDLRIAGKLLGGGVAPICALTRSPSFRARADALGMQPPRATYAGNALCAGVALALQQARPLDLESSVRQNGEWLRQFFADQLPSGVQAIGAGHLFGIHCSSNAPPDDLSRFVMRMRDNGVLAMGGARQGSFHIMFTPPLDCRRRELAAMAIRLIQAFDDYV